MLTRLVGLRPRATGRLVLDEIAGNPYQFRYSLNLPLAPFLRHREKLQFGQNEQDALTIALGLLASTGPQDMSPLLRNCLTMEAAAVALLADGESDLHSDLSAYNLATQVLSDFRDPRMITMLCNTHTIAKKLLAAEENSRVKTNMLKLMAADALAKAVEACELCYGKQNVRSVHLRRLKSTSSRLPS